ncbi:MAG: 16S rRNA (cytosine(967)-C(5))-methyltransferase RsmB [Alphaproteobacteria bacterium]|nr:16S rRNA (cytosine(967)-C(5))-methyltransferase RsmB [Alphaproteobacteria bacterium]
MNNLLDNGLQSRRVAFQILQEVLMRNTPLDQVLDRHEELKTLDSRDKSFVRMLVGTSLRRKGQLDDMIGRVAEKELHPANLRYVLYVGITQLLFMNVPHHAAVNTTVELAELENMSGQKGFINAVLRRIISEGQEWQKKQDPVQMNIPQWLLKLWIEDYGLREAAEIAQASLSEAHTDITIKNASEQKYWAEELKGTVLPTGSVRLSAAGNITELSGFEEGHWWVQDASASLPAKILGDLNGKTVIDLCAAPGGKTAQLAAGGAQVVAVDRSAKRLERLRENMDRLHLTDRVTIMVGDGGVWQPSAPVDVVLLDAPCTATGTLRRHPDVMHLKGNKDLNQLMGLQSRLLDNAAAMVKTGGMLIYCTCSLQKSEGELQVDVFLANHPDFARQAITADEVGGVEALLTPEGDLRVLPYHLAPHGGMDGFYVARMVKR